MPELLLALAAAVAILAAGLVTLYRTGRPGADNDTSVVYRRAHDDLAAAMSMLIAARRAWAEAASRPGRHAGGHRG